MILLLGPDCRYRFEVSGDGHKLLATAPNQAFNGKSHVIVVDIDPVVQALMTFYTHDTN